MKTKFSQQIFEKYSNNEFHESPSAGNGVVPRGQADGWTDMTKDKSLFAILRTRLKTV